MTKLELIQNDMIAAMKAHDKSRKDAASALMQAIKKAAIDEGCRDSIDDAFADRVILKEIKNVQEQIDTCPDSRPELKEKYQTQHDIMVQYAPRQMSADEIQKVLNDKFADLIATKNKGMIMKSVMPEFKGKADGKLVNQIITEMCK